MRDFGETRVCKITYAFGDGTYTATEVARDATDAAWDLLVAPSGLVAFELREINDSTGLAVDDIVPFWRSLGKGDAFLWQTVAAGSGGGPETGVIEAYAGNTVPSGYLICDGASVLRATYPALFTAIGVLWGSVDGTHFNVPDLDGRTIRGFGTSPFNTVGATGGASTLTLKHTHLGSVCIMVDRNLDGAQWLVWDFAITDNAQDNWNGSTAGGQIKPSGANQEVDNRGPWAAVKYIIKT